MKLKSFFQKFAGKVKATEVVEETGSPQVEKAAAFAAPAASAPPVALATGPVSAPQVASVKVPLKAAAMVHALPKAPPPAPLSPYALRGGPKNQSDWLLLQIGKMGRAFILHAEKNKLKTATPTAGPEAFVRHDMTAALLGYRLVLTAYHYHQDIPSLEALRFVRTAMIGMLHRAVDITVEQNGQREWRPQMLAIAEEQFRHTEKEIANACSRLRNKENEPFACFYASLTPAFGAKSEAHEMHLRYGAVLNDLYGKIETAMAARNQAA